MKKITLLFMDGELQLVQTNLGNVMHFTADIRKKYGSKEICVVFSKSTVEGKLWTKKQVADYVKEKVMVTVDFDLYVKEQQLEETGFTYIVIKKSLILEKLPVELKEEFQKSFC